MSLPNQLSILTILLLAAGAVVVYGDQTCSDKSQAITLKKALFCGYDKTVRPVKNHADTVNVSITIWLKYFHFEERKNVLYMNCWTIWGWHDALLQWDPKSYNGLSDMRIESDSVWVPDVAIYSMGEMGGVHHRMPSTSCFLHSDGHVQCAPPTSYAAYCAPDLTRWPFDNQECIVEMGSWTHAGRELNLLLDDDRMMTRDSVKNREWDLLSAKTVYKSYNTTVDNFPYLEIIVKLRRHAGGYAATVVIPAFVLATMALLMFFLDPLSSERLSLGCMNVLAHCLYLEYLGVMLPSNGDSTPLIVAFFRDSLLLVGISLLIAIILRGMLSSEQSPPAWISSVVGLVLESRPGKFLILNQISPQVPATGSAEDGNGLPDAIPNPPEKKPWAPVAVLLDRVCLFVFSITLVILLLAFVP